MSLTHPLVSAYLDRLDDLLRPATPATRAEVLAGVREHLVSSLPEERPSEDHVRRALAELGTPEEIAEEAYGLMGSAEGHPGVAVEATATPRLTGRPWLPVVVTVLSLLWLAVPAVIGLRGSFDPATALHPSELVLLLAVPPLWPLLVLLVAVARVWTVREKAVLIAVLPATALWLGLTGALPSGLPRLVATMAGIVAAAWVVVRLGRRGSSRAS